MKYQFGSHSAAVAAAAGSSAVDAKNDGAPTACPSAFAFSNAAVAATLCLCRHVASNCFGRSPMLPVGWYE